MPFTYLGSPVFGSCPSTFNSFFVLFVCLFVLCCFFPSIYAACYSCVSSHSSLTLSGILIYLKKIFFFICYLFSYNSLAFYIYFLAFPPCYTAPSALFYLLLPLSYIIRIYILCVYNVQSMMNVFL